jgi:starch-binding outer membrane protein, SusD/RagB family
MKRLLKDSKKIAAVLISICLLSACDNWLDVKPEKDLIRQDFWKTTEDANSALAAVYSSFRNGAMENFLWGEVRADMIKGLPGDFSSISVSNISPTNSVISWSKYYATINLANTLLYYNKDVYESDKSYTLKMKNSVDAEALFLRSFSYFYLVRLWKSVPLVLNPSISDTCDIYPANAQINANSKLEWRDNEPEIITQIISDLLIAKDKSDTMILSDNRKFRGRANKYTIMTLLADVYLWSQNYQKCIDYCDSVINSHVYSLVEGDPSTWFTIYYPGNSKESIFELQFTDDGTPDQINPFFKNFDFGSNNNVQLMTLSNGSKIFSYADYYTTLFPDASDKRVCQGPLNAHFKYMNLEADPTRKRSDISQRDAHIPYYRYSDILLMKAEALNELGRVYEAQSYVTQTAERAGLAAIVVDDSSLVSTYSQMKNFILDERAKEFVIEGKRWFDLLRNAKRNNFSNKQELGEKLINMAIDKSKDVLRSKVNDTMMYYLPIPYNEIKRNKNLKQNPFYER